MPFATTAIRITRSLHRVAVKAHVKSLGLSVKAAENNLKRATSQAGAAAAISLAAQKDSLDAHVAAGKALVALRNVRIAATTEAANIGGAL